MSTADIDVFSKLLPWIKDLGLPMVALYYLFRAYMARVDRTDKVLDEYAKVISDHTGHYEVLSNQIKDIAEAIKEDIRVRNLIFERLLTNGRQSK